MKIISSLKAAGAAGLLAFAASEFCFSAPASAAARFSIQSGGVARSAIVVEHERLKLRRRPLVIVLHAKGGVRSHRRAGFEEIAESSKPIFLYPEALSGEWPVVAGADADRDVKFLRDLVDRFVGDGRVDPRRIFLIGESSGGAFAYRAVCAGIGRPVAGLAALGAAMPADLATCATSPIAYIAINHVANPRVPFAGGAAKFGDAVFDALPAETALAIFAKNAACSAKRDDRVLSERDSHGATRSIRGAVLSYSGCKAAVELVRLEAMSVRNGRKADHQAETPVDEGQDFDSRRKVWDFLKRSGA